MDDIKYVVRIDEKGAVAKGIKFYSEPPVPHDTVLVVQDIVHGHASVVQGKLTTDQQIYEAVKREGQRRGER